MEKCLYISFNDNNLKSNNMKSGNYLLWGLALTLLFSLDSCKPKESAYKNAYEAAKAREIQENQTQVDEVTPVTKPPVTNQPVSNQTNSNQTNSNQTTSRPVSSTATNDTAQKEKVTVVGGAGIKQFSVVIGSFGTKTNAESLKERMARQGYNSFLAQNEKGMYRVIIATFSDRSSAAAERESFKNKFYPDYQDAWILDNQ